MDNVHIIIGENSFERLFQKKRWKQQFIQKHGADNLLEVDASAVLFTEILSEASTVPFISEKRLIIIEGIPKWSDEQLQQFFLSIHNDVVVVFIVDTIDKRLKMNKLLLEKALHITCKSLDRIALKKWIQIFTNTHGSTIDTEATEYLLLTVGLDQMLLASEIEKMALYSPAGITIETILTMATATSEQEIWGLLDAIAGANPHTCILYIEKLCRQGQSAQAIWAIVSWMLSQLTIMVGAIKDGARSSAECMGMYKVSFGPAKSLWNIAKKIALNPQSVILNEALQWEVATKTGGIQTSIENEEELLSILDVLVVQLCRL